MPETEQRVSMGVRVRVQGGAPWANDPYEADVQLAGVPSPGDQLEVWTGAESLFLKVDCVTWPTYTHDYNPHPLLPVVWLDRDHGLTDEQWEEVFTALREGRRP